MDRVIITSPMYVMGDMGLDVPSGYEWPVKNPQVQKIMKKLPK